MKSVTINKEVNKKMRSLSNTIYIIARILWIICSIATIIIAIGGSFLIFGISNLKVDYNNNVVIFGETIDVESSANAVGANKEYVEIGLNIIKDLYKKDNGNSIKMFFIFSVLSAIIELSIIIFLLIKVDKLFKNISMKPTPFIKENSKLLRTIGYVLTLNIIISFVLSYILNSIIALGGKVSLNLSYIILILIIFCTSHIFDYAREIQSNITEKE